MTTALFGMGVVVTSVLTRAPASRSTSYVPATWQVSQLLTIPGRSPAPVSRGVQPIATNSKSLSAKPRCECRIRLLKFCVARQVSGVRITAASIRSFCPVASGWHDRAAAGEVRVVASHANLDVVTRLPPCPSIFVVPDICCHRTPHLVAVNGGYTGGVCRPMSSVVTNGSGSFPVA
jgi:hypothetical protein